MNWLAWETRAYLGAALGGALGVLVFGRLAAAGTVAPWVVGAAMGAGCALLTGEKSTIRGVVLAAAAAWAGAVGQVVHLPHPPDAGLGTGLLAFHETLDAGLLGQHLLGMAAAFVLGRTALRGSARRRLAGA